jgi:hypothetical protein
LQGADRVAGLLGQHGATIASCAGNFNLCGQEREDS